jgi:urease accessory protein
MRGERPFIFTDLRSGKGIDDAVAWIKRNALLEDIESVR